MLWKIVKALKINVLEAEFLIIIKIRSSYKSLTIGALLIKLCNVTVTNNLYEDFKVGNCIISNGEKTTHKSIKIIQNCQKENFKGVEKKMEKKHA